MGLCQMVLMTSKTSLQKWSGVFLFPSVSPVFFQIGTVTYQHRLRFRWRGFMYEFSPLTDSALNLVILILESVMPRSSRVLSMSISRPSFVNEQVNWEAASLSPHPQAVVSGG